MSRVPSSARGEDHDRDRRETVRAARKIRHTGYTTVSHEEWSREDTPSLRVVVSYPEQRERLILLAVTLVSLVAPWAFLAPPRPDREPSHGR